MPNWRELHQTSIRPALPIDFWWESAESTTFRIHTELQTRKARLQSRDVQLSLRTYWELSARRADADRPDAVFLLGLPSRFINISTQCVFHWNLTVVSSIAVQVYFIQASESRTKRMRWLVDFLSGRVFRGFLVSLIPNDHQDSSPKPKMPFELERKQTSAYLAQSYE